MRSMSTAARGRMLVVDASCRVEVLTGTPGGEVTRERLAAEEGQAAPHIIDVGAFVHIPM